MAQKYNDFNDVMRELYRVSYLEAPKVFVAIDYGFDDYDYLKKNLDELFWETDIFQLPIRILTDATYGHDGLDSLVVKYADEYELTKILYDSNKQEYKKLSELRLEEFLKYEEILSLSTHFIVFAKECTSDFRHLIIKARERNLPTWIFDKSQETTNRK